MKITVTGAGVLSPVVGPGAPAARTEADAGYRDAPRDVYHEALPSPAGHALAGFDARKALGRKGTRAFDRATCLALVACERAIGDAGLRIDDDNRDRVGITLGTTVGSMRSTADFSRETWVNERPYMVNPMLFPNAVLNGAASQAAIWYGLRGVNTTIAGGRLGFLSALRYALRVLRRGHADVLLTGAVEEYTPHSAWATHLTTEGRAGAGEGAAMFVVESETAAGYAERQVRAEVLSVVTGFRPGVGTERLAPALANGMRSALAKAELGPADVSVAVAAESDVDSEALDAVFGGIEVDRLATTSLIGECGAASGALHLAAALAAGQPTPRTVLLTGWTPEGAVGAAVLHVPGGG